MRRLWVPLFLTAGPVFLVTAPHHVQALSEADISSELTTLRGAVTSATATVPLDAALNATCGGLLFASDPRAQEHQIRSPAFSCDLLRSCSLYEESTGDCIGFECVVEECASTSCKYASSLQRLYAGYPYRPYWWGWPYWHANLCNAGWGCDRMMNCNAAGTGCTLTQCQGRCGKLNDCRSGTCTPMMGKDTCGNIAPRSCTPLGSVSVGSLTINFSGARSSRRYRCDNTAGCIYDASSQAYTCGTGISGQYTADVRCYSYSAPVTDSWYHPNAYNCRATFQDLPVNPPGEPSLVARTQPTPVERLPDLRQDPSPWQAVQRSTIACAASDPQGRGHDASILPAVSDLGSFDVPAISPSSHFAVTDWWPDPWNVSWHSQYGGFWYMPRRSPDLTPVLTDLRNPPEVRLILPTESFGFSLGTGSTLLSQLSPRLAFPKSPSAVMVQIRSVPDVLEVAAEVIRTLPLLRVEFLPVDLLLPHVEEAEIRTLIKDWEHWLRWAQEAASAPSADPAIARRLADVQSLIDDPSTGILARLQEYLVLLRDMRRYRAVLPTYIDAVLTAVERANTFYEAWLTENAARLQDWRDVQEYLPVFAEELRALHEDAVDYVDSCLLPACIGAMPGIPVASGTLPWEVFGEVAGVNMVEPPLNFRDRAWLPGAWRVWENAFGRFGYRNPRHLTVGTPLADLTIDFSSLPFGRTFAIPLLRVSLLPLNLPHPPDAPVAKMEDIPDPWEIRTLPEIRLPAFPLSVPELVLPDPDDSLFFIPEPPRPLTVVPGTPPQHIGNQLIAWERDRLAKLKAEACFNPGSKSYLVSEAIVGNQIESTTSPATLTSIVSRPVAAYVLSAVPPPWCVACALLRPQQEARQVMTVDAAWEDVQEEVLHLADEWNAQIRFLSVTPRSDLEQVEQTMRWYLVSGDDPLRSPFSSLTDSIRRAARNILRVFPSLS